jgi:23S rRNA pseudouridine1911/1915/1917 synthase
MLQPDSMVSAMHAATQLRHVLHDEVKEGPSLISGPPSRGSIANPPTGAGTAGDGAEFRAHELELPAGLAGLRLDAALAKVLPQYSRARLQGWIRAGAVTVDGRLPRTRDLVRGEELVRIEARIEPVGKVSADAMRLEVIFRDAQLLVINKPAGLVVHPGAGNARNTLQNGLLAYDPALARVPRAGIVHRLDKDTSGLLLVARTPEAHTALSAALTARQIRRGYVALCTGVMTGGGTVDQPIGRHRSQRTRMAVRADGRAAVTHFRILRRLRAHTLVSVELETGRTHQIRVHLAHLGYPLVGDPLYGGRRRLPPGASAALIAELGGFRRQALHAAHLALTHPTTGKALAFEAPMPADFAALLAALAAEE